MPILTSLLSSNGIDSKNAATEFSFNWNTDEKIEETQSEFFDLAPKPINQSV